MSQLWGGRFADGPDPFFSSDRLRAWTDEFAMGVASISDSGPITSS